MIGAFFQPCEQGIVMTNPGLGRHPRSIASALMMRLPSMLRAPWLLVLLPMALILLPVATAWAHHLHYIPITDTSFPENDPNSPQYVPDWVIADTYGETPLHRWVIYSGDDRFSAIDTVTNTYSASTGSGTAQAVFDFPDFDDIANPQITAFYEFRIVQLDDSGLQSIEIGLTDLINQIKWDEAAGVISGSRSVVAGDDVNGIPPWSTLGDLPLRLQIYYSFSSHVITYVLIDDAAHASRSVSWQGSGNPFQNFYGDVPGTDPDNLDIYSYALCEAECSIAVRKWGELNCDVVNGAVDVANCGVDNLVITNNDGQTTYAPGGSLTYVLTAINFTQINVAAASVNDTFPPGLSCNWTCYGSGGASCAASGSGNIAESVSLPAGSSASFFATCDIDSGQTGSLVNTATISQPGIFSTALDENSTATDTDTNANDPIFADGFE